MTDFVIDGKPYEPPESAAAEGYAKTPPATGAFGAMATSESSILTLGRAAERGSQADSSALDQLLYRATDDPDVAMGRSLYTAQHGAAQAGQNYLAAPPEPAQNAPLPADEINSRFGPTGPDGKPVQITDRPMSADLGAIIGRQKTESMERDSVIARNEAVHSWPTNFATGMAAFMLDPLNQATAFVPGIGEETVLAGMGRVGMSGVAARMGARAITGATFGAAQQLPLVALRATLDPEEAVDYGWRDALRDVFYNAAFAAGMHAGIMGTGRELGFFRPDAIMGRPLGEPRAEMPPPAPGRAETAAVPDAAFAPERAAALHEAFEGAEPTDQVDLADHGFEPHEIAALDHAGLAFPDGTMVRGQWEAWEQERDARAPIEEKPPAVVQAAEPPKPVPEAADMPRSPMARRDAQSSAIVQVLNGEPVDIRPIVAAEEAVAPRDPMELRPPRSIADIITEEHLTGSERTIGRKAVEIRNAEIVEYAATQARLRAAGLPTTPADVAAKQREIQRNGTATGIPDGDLRAASEGLYAPKPVEEAPPKAAAVPRETQTKPVEGEAPAEAAPPRLRTVSQIMQEDGVSAAKAAEKQLAEVLARGREVTPEDIAARKAALEDRRAARQANAEVERVAADAGVDATGKAPEQVFAKAVDSLPPEQVVADVESHGEAMDAVLAEAEKQAKEWIAYHGSPHDFEQVEPGHVGKGEGNQAYGWGELYAAESLDIGKGYQVSTSSHLSAPADMLRDLAKKEDLSDEAIGFLRYQTGAQPTVEAAVAWARNGNIELRLLPEDVVRRMVEAQKKASVGHLYTVRIKATPDEMLDWDRPLSEQPPKVRDAVLDLLKKTGHEVLPGDLESGSAAYHMLGERDLTRPRQGEDTSPFASKALRAAGIKGIRYLDANSRKTRGSATEIENAEESVRQSEGLISDANAEIESGIKEGTISQGRVDYLERNIDAFQTELEDKRQTLIDLKHVREPPDATHNVVVFDHSDVEITHKDGEPVTPRAPTAAEVKDLTPSPTRPTEETHAAIYGAATTESIEEIEHDLQQTDRTPPVGEGEGGSEQPTVAAEHPEPVPAGGGPRPSGAGVEQRPGEEVPGGRPAAGAPAGPVAAAAGPAAERGAEPVPVAGERLVDGRGNPIFQKGERVVVPDGPLAGRHGEIIEATGIRFAPIFGGRATEANYHYQVRTDSGAVTYASKLDLETGEKPKAVPDPLWHGHPYDPEALKRLVDNNRANEQRALRAGARARTQTSKRSHADAAREARREGDAQQAVLDAWRAANPTEAEHALPEPERAPPPAPMAGGMALVESRHAKKGIPLFVVTMSERVPRERYDELSAGAKEGGGYYSSFKGHGAVPGFTFNDRAAAEAFLRRFGEAAVESKPAMAPSITPAPDWWNALTSAGKRRVLDAAGKRQTAATIGWHYLSAADRTALEAHQGAAEEAAPLAESKLTPEGLTKHPEYTQIGTNTDGRPLFENAQGVRYYVTDQGFRSTEPVQMEITSAGVRPSGRPLERKSADFLTVGERQALRPDIEAGDRVVAKPDSGWPAGTEGEVIPGARVQTTNGNWTMLVRFPEGTRTVHVAEFEKAGAAPGPTPAEVTAQAGGAPVTGLPPLPAGLPAVGDTVHLRMQGSGRQPTPYRITEYKQIPDGAWVFRATDPGGGTLTDSVATLNVRSPEARDVADAIAPAEGKGPLPVTSAPPTETKSWAPEVKVEGKWSRNATRFATKEEAEAAASELHSRWMMSEGSRATEAVEPANWRWEKGTGIHPIEEPTPLAEAPPLAATSRPPGAERPAEWGANNKLVTRADADAIRARLRAKVAQLRTGIDPEMMLDGARLAVFHIEAGARAFTDYAHEMLTDLGEEFRPYLRSWYESARHWPGIDARDMTAGAEIEAELTRTATAPTTEPITREEANRILDLHRGDPIIETIGNRIAEGHAADEIAEMPGVRFTAAEIAGLADAMEARGLIHEPEEAEEDELHGAVHPGDAGAGAEDVHGTAALGEAGAIRAGEGAGGGRPGGANAGAAPEGRPGPAEPGGQAGGRGNRPRPAAGVRAGRPAGEPGAAGRPAARPDDSVQGTNFTIEAGALEEGRGPKAKARDNLAAIRLAKQLTEESRPATRAEQEILAKYVGWGGLKGAFRGTDGRFGTGFEDIGEQLHDALTDEEYRTASRSTQYAHYTAEHVVRSMWEAVRRMGFDGGNVFEPGMGTGHFLGMMPTDLSAKSRYQGIKMDHLTASIAKLLYPQSGVRQADFIRTPIPEGTFDLVIGNPPFSDTVVAADPKYAARSFMLHDYFFAKSLDSVRPGGLLSFVTSAGTMNKLDSAAREYLAERADFVGGIRLNSSAFRRNAGTEVTTDILFFKRRPEGRVALPEGEKPAWTETTVRAFPNAEGTATEGNVSRYFSEHPENVLGQEGFFDKLYKDRYAVHALPGSDLAADLRDAVERLPEGVMTPPLSQEARAALDFASGQTKDGSFYAAPDGRLMQYRDGAGREVARRGKGATGGLTAAEHERVTGLIPVRDALRDVFAADLARDEALGAAARERLNQHYDGFVRKFGPINLTETRFQRPTIAQAEEARLREREEARYVGDPWDDGDFDPTAMLDRRAKISEIAKARDAARQAAAAAGRKFNEGTFDPEEMPDNAYERYPNVHKFMGDPESYRVRSIEDYDQATGAASKKAIFHESILKHEQEPELKSANDGVLWSMNKLGRFDVDAIAEKMGRERADIIAELGDSVFKVPGTEDTYQTKDEYLSGDIVDKLEQARTAAEHDPDIRRNIEALEGAMPPPLPPSAISMVLGMPWIPTETVRGFVRDHLELGNPAIMHSDITGTWHVMEGRGNAPGAERWGTAKRDAYELLSDAMNRTPPRIYDQERGEGGKTVRVFNEVATQAAQDMVDKIKAEFTTWVAADEARADGLAQVYNDRLNRTVLRQYDGSYLTTPGVASDWRWRPHQTRVVARIVQSGNTYMAHAVGAGKTSAMIGAAMEMRRLGLVRKPIFVIPNHMLGQFTKEFYEQYPTARIVVADEERFHTSRRKQFVANAAQNDLDAIIMTHSSFGKIPISDEFQSGLIDEQIEDLRAAMEELDETSDRHTVGRIEHQIEALEQKLSGQGGGSKDQGLTFEELGADFLFTDEAHQFRKLSFGTKQGNLKGISPEGSDMAWDLYSKVRYLDSQRPGRSVVFASGTPITNTMGELYSLSRYLQRETLAKQGLSHFDSWAQTFGDTKTDLEETAAGTYQPVTRFQRFVNLPELYKMVGEVMDIVTPNQLEQYVVRPKLETGARQFHLAPRTPILDAYQAHLGQRMDAIKARKGPPKKGDDILLSVINDGRHAAIDPRFVAETQSDPRSKLNEMVKNIGRVWRDTADKQFYDPSTNFEKPSFRGPATQMVFMNLGVNGRGPMAFSAYQWVREALRREGIPANEIAFIGDYKGAVQRQKLFNDMNEGKVRVLVGSTQKMGTGVNVQRRLYAVHNLDPLWYPADDEQRVGRILRQGNHNPEIEVHDYSTKGTYDSAMWKMMGSKGRFIEQFYRGDPALRNMEDLGEASMFEQASAMSTTDERIITLTELKQNLDRARRRESAHQSEQYSLRQSLRTQESRAEDYTAHAAAVRRDIEQRHDTSGDNFTMQVGAEKFDKRGDAGVALDKAIRDRVAELGRSSDPVTVANIGGFRIAVERTAVDAVRVTLRLGSGWEPLSYKYLGSDESVKLLNAQRAADGQDPVRQNAVGTISSAETALRTLETRAALADRNAAEAHQRAENIRPLIGQRFEGTPEILHLAQSVHDLEAQLRGEAEAKKRAAAGEEEAAPAARPPAAPGEQAAAAPPDPEMEAAMQRLSDLQDDLEPEDRAAIADAGRATAEAEQKAAAIDEAANCLKGSA